MRVRLDEARFFFPPTEARLFSRIETLAAEHEGARSVMKNTNDETDRMKAGEAAAEKLMELVRIYETLTPYLEARAARRRREASFAAKQARERETTCHPPVIS
jgi:hypothetical protein